MDRAQRRLKHLGHLKRPDGSCRHPMVEAFRILVAVGKPADPGPVRDPEGVQEALDRMEWLASLAEENESLRDERYDSLSKWGQMVELEGTLASERARADGPPKDGGHYAVRSFAGGGKLALELSCGHTIYVSAYGRYAQAATITCPTCANPESETDDG